jgi:hypothetical protein
MPAQLSSCSERSAVAGIGFGRGVQLRSRPMRPGSSFRGPSARAGVSGIEILLTQLSQAFKNRVGLASQVSVPHTQAALIRGMTVKPSRSPQPDRPLLGLAAVLLAAVTREAYCCPFPRQT